MDITLYQCLKIIDLISTMITNPLKDMYDIQKIIDQHYSRVQQQHIKEYIINKFMSPEHVYCYNDLINTCIVDLKYEDAFKIIKLVNISLNGTVFFE